MHSVFALSHVGSSWLEQKYSSPLTHRSLIAVVLQVLKLVTCIRKGMPGRQTLKSSAQDTLSFPPDPHPPSSQNGYGDQ